MWRRLAAALTGLSRPGSIPSASTFRAVESDQSSGSTRNRMPDSCSAFSNTFTRIFRSSLLLSLRNELAIEKEGRIRLDAQCAILRSELERANERLDEALKNERIVYQTGVNVSYQQKYGIIPFPGAPRIPDSLDQAKMPMQIPPDYVDVRSVQAERLSAFTERYRELKAGKN